MEIKTVQEFEDALKAGHRVTVEPQAVVTITRTQASDVHQLHAALKQAGGWANLKIVED